MNNETRKVIWGSIEHDILVREGWETFQFVEIKGGITLALMHREEW